MPTPPAAKKARKTEPHRSPDDILDIDPEGDLVLKIEADPGFWMRNSSKHLTIVSKVFEALLGPHFAEGQESHVASNPLCLLDDDPRALELLCKLAHHKITKTSDISAKDLGGLVIACDKYDCLASFRLNFHVVLKDWLASSSEQDWSGYKRSYSGITLLEALCIAFIADDEAAFAQISKLTFLLLPNPNLWKKTAVILRQLLALMPQDFLEKLGLARNEAMELASKHMCSPLRDFDADQRSRVGLLKVEDHCKPSILRAGLYSVELAHQDFLPFSMESYHPPPKSFHDRVDETEAKLKSLTHVPSNCTGKCADCSFDWKTAIEDAAKKTKTQIGSLCLLQVKEGNFDTRTCRCLLCGVL